MWTQEELALRTPTDVAEKQILELQKAIDFDVKEFTVELFAQKLNAEEIFAPDYQRKKIWSDDHRSRFIESVILGYPIPFLFLADNSDGRLEIIDGYQRLSTIQEFGRNEFRLDGLEKLTTLIGYQYDDLPSAQARKYNNRTIRAIVLSDRADPNVRFDIFERINSGSIVLSPAEFRKGAFRGPFYELVLDLANDKEFEKLCPIGRNREKRGEREELILRFFAYSDKYQDFTHDVAKFLNEYIREQNRTQNHDIKRTNFHRMLNFVDRYFPYGFRKTKSSKSTPRVRFEAISVGVHLALEDNANIDPEELEWLESKRFEKETTTHASNSAPRLRSRVEFVRDALLGVDQQC